MRSHISKIEFIRLRFKRIIKVLFLLLLLLLSSLIVEIVLPYYINGFLLENKEIIGEPSSWMPLWVTYIGSLASLIMVVLTWHILKQNQKQINLMKAEWKEQNKLKLYPFIGVSDGNVLLIIKNFSSQYGAEIQTNITYSNIDDLNIKERIAKINKSVFNIEPYGIKKILLSYDYYVDKVYNGEIIVTLSLLNSLISKTKINLTELNIVNVDKEYKDSLVKSINSLSSTIKQGIKIS